MTALKLKQTPVKETKLKTSHSGKRYLQGKSLTLGWHSDFI